MAMSHPAPGTPAALTRAALRPSASLSLPPRPQLRDAYWHSKPGSRGRSAAEAHGNGAARGARGGKSTDGRAATPESPRRNGAMKKYFMIVAVLVATSAQVFAYTYPTAVTAG